MTTLDLPAEPGRKRPWHRVRQLSPDKLLLRKYKLDKSERLHMILAGVVLSQLAAPIGSALYFLFTQVSYKTTYGSTTITWLGLKDTWDRLPVHLENLTGIRWFTGQAAPPWWVTARHDFRHVLIGFLVTLLVGAITVGLKNRRRASTAHMVASVPIAFLTAAVVAAPLIWLSTLLPHLGLVTGNPWLSDWVGKGTIQLTLVGILAAIPARKILARTMSTLQLMSLEKKIARHETPRWWWRFLYLPNYRKRYAMLVESHYVPPVEPGKAMGVVLALSTPALLFWLAFGIWLLYFGPAAGA